MEDLRSRQDARWTNKAAAWLRVIRLQFYPMTLITYSVGAPLAARISGGFDPLVYGLGYLFLFLTEVATVLTNEYYDYNSDSANRNAGPFTGGSRILVNGRLSFREVRAGIIVALSAATLCGLPLLLTIFQRQQAPVTAIVLLLIGIVLGMAYTAPPLKLSHRGLGELVVGLANGPYVVLCGFVFQSGVWLHPQPWIFSVPIMFAIISAITLSGIPDFEADRGGSKTTLAVLMGPQAAAWVSIVSVAIACAAGLLLWFTGSLTGPTGTLILGAVPHAIILMVSIRNLINSGHFDRPINTIMVLSLSYILWFGIIPLLGLIIR